MRTKGVHGELELSLKQDTEEHSSSSGTKRKTESSISEEILRLETEGNVFDPRLMTFMAGVGFGLNQQSYKSDTQSSYASGDMNSYRLRMNFLSTKPYPFSLHTSKREMFSPRRFQSPLRIENTTTGASLKLRNPNWPMTFNWINSEIEQRSDIDDTEDFFNRYSDSFSYTLRHDFSERSRFTFRSDLDEVNRESRSFVRDTKTIRHKLVHDFEFGDNLQHSLYSMVSLMDKTDTFESETFEWNENMFLRHSDRFSTYYNAFLSKSTFASIENQTISGAAGFNHQLYRNLNTNFNVFTIESEFGESSKATSQGGNLRFNYMRNNPWGLLLSNYSINMTMQESTSETGTGIVTDESHVFDSSFPYITLDERNIVVSTIVVTNVAGDEVYTEGDDYTVSVIGDRVELTVTELGMVGWNISDGDTLYVDYLFNVADSRQEDFVTQFFRIKQEFSNGWSVFYSHRNRTSEIDSDLETTPSDREYTTDTYGVDYKNKYLTLRAEHSSTESTENSSESDIVSAGLLWPLTPKTSLHGQISQSWLESSGTNSRETSVFRAEGGIRTSLTRHLRLSGDVELRDEENSDIGPTEGLRMGVALQYNRRALSVRAGWDSYSLERYNTERNSSNFYVKLIRQF